MWRPKAITSLSSLVRSRLPRTTLAAVVRLAPRPYSTGITNLLDSKITGTEDAETGAKTSSTSKEHNGKKVPFKPDDPVLAKLMAPMSETEFNTLVDQLARQVKSMKPGDRLQEIGKRNKVKTACIYQPLMVVLPAFRSQLETGKFTHGAIILNYLIKRAQHEQPLYEALQQTLFQLCPRNQERYHQSMYTRLLHRNNLFDTRINIMPFLLSTALKARRKGGMFFTRPQDFLILLDKYPELTPLANEYIYRFRQEILHVRKKDMFTPLWEKLFIILQKGNGIEWVEKRPTILQHLSPAFWAQIITSGKDAPTMAQISEAVDNVPPAQVVWIEATLQTNELSAANKIVDEMLDQGYAATEAVGQHLVKLFTKDMDPVEALNVIDGLHAQYGSYVSLHGSFFSHWCRTRNSEAVLKMLKVLETRNQVSLEVYEEGFMAMNQAGDYNAALYAISKMVPFLKELNPEIKMRKASYFAGEFLSSCLYRGRQSVFPSGATNESDMLTEGLRYHIHVDKFANYITKFNRDPGLTRLPIHRALYYLHKLNEMGCYANVQWYAYNLEMMQVSAITQKELVLFVEGASRMLRRSNLGYDALGDLIHRSETLASLMNAKRAALGKTNLCEETPSAHEEDVVVKGLTTGCFMGNYSTVFDSPYFHFETVKWGAIKSPTDPGSGVRILNYLQKYGSDIKPHVIAEAIQHVAGKLYITTPPSYRRLRSQTPYNMEEFIAVCAKEWEGGANQKTI